MEEFAKHIAEKTNYLNKEIVYLKNTRITEYDIRSAGFTVIKSKRLLPQEELEMLDKMEKHERNVWIGKRILKYPKISEEIINTLAQVRSDFVVMNRIREEDILSIKKDAIFLIKATPEFLKVGDFEFRPKAAYSSYLYVNQKEFYYSSGNDTMDIKGVPEEAKAQQEKFLLRDIRKVLSMGEKLTSDQMFTFLKQYRSKYLGRQLEPGTYRDLESGMFSVDGYAMDSVSQETMSGLDISQNYIKYLVPLFRALL
jgi:hypothetical protein